MILLAVAAVIAESADLLSYRPDNEWYIVTQALGPVAPYLKVALIVYLAWLAYVLPPRYARRVFTFAVVAGTLGFLSNVA